ncbi:flavin reductase family protein [Amycolatopsis sp. NPDC004079]|uniref:flavin reductase family protein n=1 Tax=Amycolatopsis sp. NPDC004079 TaxID=3154549 RepID=UPI0033A09D0C
MRLFPTGVALLTAGEGDTAMGMTVNSVVSVSLSPPILLVSVHRSARITGHVVPGMEFAVSLLGTEQVHLTRRFAAADRPVGEAAVSVLGGALAASGVPIPAGALGVVQCVVERTVPVGDHVLVLGLVVCAEASAEESSPQVFHRGSLTTVARAVR